MTRVKYIKSNEIEKSWKSDTRKIHSLHRLCSRVCSFPPTLARYFIEKYSQPNGVVFDSWSGVGVVPLEACINNRIGIGNDISPEAYILTFAKTHPLEIKQVNVALSQLKCAMRNVEYSGIEDELYCNASIFFSDKTFEQILKAREFLLNKNSDKWIFIKALMLGIIHGSSQNSLSLSCSHSFSMSPKYVKKYAYEHNLERPNRDIISCLKDRAYNILSDGTPMITGHAYMDDSKMLSLDSESVDLILTSPPYLDIQTYAWCNWLRLWFLGYDYKEVRKSITETGSLDIYREFIEKSLNELNRVLKEDGNCFIVIGDLKKIKYHNSGEKTIKKIYTVPFLKKIIERSGFDIDSVIKDSIPCGNKVLLGVPQDGGIKRENIIHLRKNL